MAVSKDPFEYGRIEQESSPIVYVPAFALSWLKAQSQLLEGPRGCGKSSLLNAMRWEAVWSDRPAVQIRGSDQVERRFVKKPKHLGIYYRMQEMDLHSWHYWHARVGQQVAQGYFGTYLELTLAYLFVDALHRIRQHDGQLFTSRAAELELVDRVLRAAFPREETRPTLIEDSFSALASLLLDRQLGLSDVVNRGGSVGEVSAVYQVLGPGNVVRTLATVFRDRYPEQSDWIMVVLLDDCNLLDEWQASVLNTAIAKAETPLSYKLSSVKGLYPTRSTLNPVQSLTEHDLQEVALPNLHTQESRPVESNTEYVDLANHVCKIRLEKFYDEKLADEFDLGSVLGTFDIDEALEKQLRTSQKRVVQQFLLRATSPEGRPAITATWMREHEVREEDEPPPDDPDARKKRDRRMATKYLNKWSRAAAVALMYEFDKGFPYWGLPVVLHLGHGSIREVLRVMSGMWQAADLPAERFVARKPLNHRIQLQGVLKAANKFVDSLNNKPLTEDGPSLSEICNRLGELFASFQRMPYMQVLPETASVRVCAALPEELIGIVNQGLTAGALLKQEDDSGLAIGLHPIMSPRFGISFRPPFYYPETITLEQFSAVMTGSESDYRRAVREILEHRICRRLMKAQDRELRADQTVSDPMQGVLFHVVGEQDNVETD